MLLSLKTFTLLFAGPPLEAQAVGSALVSLNDNLLLINGPEIRKLACNVQRVKRQPDLGCIWFPATRLVHSRKYPVAMLVSKSIINTGTTSINTTPISKLPVFDGMLQPPVFVVNKFGK